MKNFKKLFAVGALLATSLAGVIITRNVENKVNAEVPAGQKLDTNIDTISVSDLSFNGYSNQTMIVKNENTDVSFNFSEENTNKSLVFKFKYEIVGYNEERKNNDSACLRIHMDVADDKWNTDNSFMIRPDNLFLMKWNSSNSAYSWSTQPSLSNGTYDIEFGRVALLDETTSQPSGQYYVYYKVDGVQKDYSISTFDVSKMGNTMFLNIGSDNPYNKVYDSDLTYEEPQYISVNDLQNNNTGSILTPKNAYKYDLSVAPTNKSVVFVANWVNKANDWANFFIGGEGSFNNGTKNIEYNYYEGGSISPRQDRVYIYKTNAETGLVEGDAKSFTYPATLEIGADKVYRIEYGRLAIMDGTTFTGRYHVYYKIDGQLIGAIDQKLLDGVAAGGYFRIGGFDNDIVDAYTYEEPKVINVNDLSYDGAQVVDTHTITTAGGETFTWDNSDHTTNYSIDFKCKYTPVGTSENQFHFKKTNIWDADGSFIVNRSNTQNFVGLYGTWKSGANFTYTSGNTYNLEYIRKAVLLDGQFLGKYYICLKIDNTIIKEGITSLPEADVQTNQVFISPGDKQSVIADMNPTSYETPDEISIGDLKVGGNSIGDVATLSSHTTYTYTATAAHKSVVYKFKYEVLGSKPDCQFHFNTGWTGDYSAGMIWVTDKIYVRKETGAKPAAYVSATNPMNKAGTYEVEIGKLYITGGKNAGGYYLYAKVDGQLIACHITTATLPDAAGLFTSGTNGDKLYDIDYVPVANDANPDVISVSDLTVGGKTNLSFMSNENQGASYTKTNANGSLVYKFNYEVNDTTDTDKIAVRIHFDVADDQWNSDCALWIRGDGVYLSKYADSAFGWSKKTALTAGTHEIEFGRLAILNNNVPTGNYYIYYKVDGVEANNKTIAYDVSKMDNTLFFNFSAGNTMNKMIDVNYVEPEFEAADEISVSELRIGGYLVGNQVVLDQAQTYSYDATAAHKSVVFNFLYEAKKADFSCQVHFTNTWIGNQAGMIWLQNGKLHISKDSEDSTAKYVEVTSPFTAAGIYDVEIGKLYYEKGADQGKYYIYLMVNGTLIAETIAASMPDNNFLFTTGSTGDVIYDVNHMPVNVESDLYIYKWNANKSGIQFEASLNKAYVDYRHVSEAGFILVPQEEYKGSLNINSNNAGIIKMAGKLVEDGSNYVVKAALAGLKQENIASSYVAVAYVKMENAKDEGTVYSYSDACVTSFYEELQDLTGATEAQATILNGIKAKVLVATINEDNCAVTGVTKTGDFDATSIVLTGENAEYYAYILNGKALRDEEVIMIGYRNYKVALGTNTITLTKQDTDLVYGVSEHFHELNSGIAESSNAVSLAPMTSNIGLTTVRFDLELSRIFSVKADDKLVVNKDEVLKTQAVLDELKANGGVTEFLAVLWVVQPDGCYAGGQGLPATNNTAPNPTTQAEAYQRWLNINSEAAKLAAKLFPDVNAFETWNEAEFNNMLVQNDGTAYDLATKTRILTDLMYYYRKGIKESNPDAVLTTNSLCCYQQTGNSDFACTSQDFLRALYAAIKDTTPVTGYTEVDTDANNYFDIINIHPYTQLGTTVSNWKSFVEGFSTIACDNGDNGTEVWITEFGFSNYSGSDASNQTKLLQLLAQAEEIDSLTRLYFYLVHDDPNGYGGNVTYWGFYNVDGTIKEVGTAVKNFIAEQA